MDVRLGVIVDAAKAIAGSQQAAKAIKSIGTAAASASSRILGASSALFRLATAATGLTAIGLAPSMIRVASSVEQASLRMNVLLGDVKEGNRLFQDMTKFASQVPFEFQDIMQSATQLSGVMSGGVDEINKWMPLIADLAAVSGLGIQTTTEQVVRMYSAGAAAADLFRERGITAMLGFQAGVSVSAEETRKRLIQAFEDPASKFRGASELLANTWTGTLSMISDKWFNFQKEFSERSGLFNYFKAIARLIDKNMGDALNASKDKMREWGNVILDVFKRIVMGGARIVDTLRGPFKFITSAINEIWEGFKQLPGWAQDLGVVGALIFGRKGIAVLAAGSLLAEKTKITAEWFGAFTEGKIGFFEWLTTGSDEAVKRLEQLKMMTGTIIRDGEEGKNAGALFPEGSAQRWAADALSAIDTVVKQIEADQAALAEKFSGGGGGGETAADRAKREAREKQQKDDQDAAVKNLDALEEQFMTEEERLRESYDRRNEIIQVAREQGLLTEKRYGDLHAKNEAKFENDMRKMKEKNWGQQLTAAGTFFNSLMSLSQGQSKGLFKLAKLGAVATATIDAYTAYNAALKNPPGPPWTYPIAAAALVAGLAKVQAINSTQFEGGGGAGGTGAIGGGGVIPQPIPPTPTENVSQTEAQSAVKIEIVGDIYGFDDYVQNKIIDAIRTAVDDRDVVLIGGNSRNAREIVNG